MVKYSPIVIAVATAATIFYSANPALGAAIPYRRDDQMQLVARGEKHSVKHHSAKWWKAAYQLKSKDFLRVLKLFKLYITKGSEKEKAKILKQLSTAQKIGSKDADSHKKTKKGKTDKKKTDEKKTKSFKASKEKKEEEENESAKSDVKTRDVEDALVARELDNDELFAREFDEDELIARDYESDDLVARDFDDEELLARDFDDEELLARDFEDVDLVVRDLVEGLSEPEGRDLLDAVSDLDARDFGEEFFERSDEYDLD